MSSTILNRTTALIPLYRARLTSHPTLTLTLTALAISLIPLTRAAASSYRGFVALGRGGIPNNLIGWLMQLAMKPLAQHGDLADPWPYRETHVQRGLAPLGSETFLAGPLPPRAGARPTVPGYVVPQRQTTDVAAPELRARMAAHLEIVARANAGVLVAGPSQIEKGGPAVFVAAEETFVACLRGTMLRREAGHVHGEGSSHVTLSVRDAEEVVVKGWGERHGLSGTRFLPWTYVMVYAPRDEDELAVWKDVVRASCAFVSGGQEIRD